MPNILPLPGLLSRFGLGPGRLAAEHSLPGSPERCITRYAVEDAGGWPWMLERITPSQAPRREELGALLAALRPDPVLGPLLPAYRPVVHAGGGGEAGGEATRHFVLRIDAPPPPQGLGGLWTLSPFVAGAPLPRPDYLDHAWRGEAAARAILAMHRAGRALPQLPTAPQASLPAYRDGLFAAITAHAPELLPRLAPARALLAGLEQALRAVPLALAHGDLHPLNIIWGSDAVRPIRALIDWEFAGARPRLYDAANCLGCAGFEHPSGLARGFAVGLARGLQAGGIPATELRLLPLFTLCSRLGWLSEWLRKKDAELLDMELDYLDILTQEQEGLAALWSGGQEESRGEPPGEGAGV